VQVCPTGIDIRDGLQYECIACAACIDGCDEVMKRVGLPVGLIKYSTQAQNQGNGKSLKQTVLRPRVLIYGTLLAMVFIGFISALVMRSSFQVDILRDRNALYRWSKTNDIENSYQVRVMNKSQLDQRYTVAVRGLEGASADWGKTSEAGRSRVVQAGDIGEFIVIITLPATANYQRSQDIELYFSETVGKSPSSIAEESRFWGPAKRN
jgi:cytochrome c oxidase accessory protein FixG